MFPATENLIWAYLYISFKDHNSPQATCQEKKNKGLMYSEIFVS